MWGGLVDEPVRQEGVGLDPQERPYPHQRPSYMAGTTVCTPENVMYNEGEARVVHDI
jgi:hypothetical protein